ncbi:hypothetical protein [Streptacidiphilus jiangxiensis]|uniref:Uncharacterized protein n=1 Tax=Streptacidiphilus jiangxiensis TaxID=235985 RepID=A0A1H7MXM0_STRJI|nr:hypothetical protein [Streptacidiphilus jiangxiensis]SEL15528.1 hypothetical protein SAMN05414137_106100 [Streptacidiphilus jiangxiensis]
MGQTITTLVPVAVLLATVFWVYRDATLRARRGRPVYFSVGSLEVSRPATWALGCLCLWILVTPLYLTCRRQAG